MTTPSIGSTASRASVGFHGETVDMEVALDDTVRQLQGHLNNVQQLLRNIAVIVEQDADFKTEVAESDKVDDELRRMGWLFADFRHIVDDLISIPDTKEDKAWFKLHKKERAATEKVLQAEHDAQEKAERAASKAALKLAQASIAEGDEDTEMKH